MNIETIRSKTAKAKAAAAAKFENSKLHKYIDGLIEKEALRGKSILKVNYSGCLYNVYGNEHCVKPLMSEVIEFYNGIGFVARETYCIALNGMYNTVLEIRW